MTQESKVAADTQLKDSCGHPAFLKPLLGQSKPTKKGSEQKLTREEIKNLNQEIDSWREKAQEVIRALDSEEKEYLRDLIRTFERKNSRRLAIGVLDEIGNFLGISSPARFIRENKWMGFFGLNYIADRTIRRLKGGENS